MLNVIQIFFSFYLTYETFYSIFFIISLSATDFCACFRYFLLYRHIENSFLNNKTVTTRKSFLSKVLRYIFETISKWNAYALRITAKIKIMIA